MQCSTEGRPAAQKETERRKRQKGMKLQAHSWDRPSGPAAVRSSFARELSRAFAMRGDPFAGARKIQGHCCHSFLSNLLAIQ